MDRLKKKWLAMVLALCMVLGLLSGCNKKGGDSQQLSATVYVPKFVDLGVDLAEIRDCCTNDEYIYLVGMEEHQEEKIFPDSGETYTDITYITDLYRIPLEGGTAEKLPNYEAPVVPEGYEGRAYIEDLSIGSDGTLWVNESVYVWGKVGENEKYGIMTDAVYPTASSTIARATVDVAVDTADVEEPMDEIDYEELESMNTNVRRHISSDGAELERIDLDEDSIRETLGVEYLNGSVFGDDGTFYVTDDKKLYVLDKDMNPLFDLDLPTDRWANVIALSDGKLCTLSYFYDEAKEISGYKVNMLDKENQAWGAEYLLPPSAYQVFPGGGDYLFYYQVNDAIFGWRNDAPAGTEAGERLFSWIEADINADSIQNFSFLPDGRVAAITREWISTGDESRVEINAVIMTATPRDQLPEKTTLTYGTMYLNYNDRRKIIDFNKNSDKYRIEVKDYSEFNTGSDSGAGLQKLNTEIIAGIVPDILSTDGLPAKQYAAKGVLEDLWPFIDNDPDLSRDKLMIRPLEVSQVNGKLYELFGDFSVMSVVGPKNVVGDRMSWTLADLNAALANMPEGCAIFGESDTKDGMLSTVISRNMESFVDWDAGKCYFDTDNFKSLLAFCNSFKTEFDYDSIDYDEWEDAETRILKGKQMLRSVYIGDFNWSFQRYQAVFPDGMSYIGLPMEDGSVGSSFSSGMSYAISTTCKDKDGAWSYLRQILLPQDEDDRYYYGDFPINKADFDKQVETAMTPEYATDENGEPYLDENGEPYITNLGSMWLNDGSELKFHLLTQAELDQFMDLYNAISTMYRYDNSIYEIVQEVAGAYFAGDKGLDETASLIQNRVNLYVNESK